MPATSHVALLRGINVGGKNKLAMKDLAGLFTDAGCTRVVTYIQSGNVIFQAPPRLLKELAPRLTQRIAEHGGLHIPVILRNAAELAETLAHNPFLQPGADESALYVMFLADAPARAAIAGLDPNRSPTDEFAVRGREVYLCLRTGAARTKFTNAWLDKQLATVSTARNWRTVQKLHQLLIENQSA